MFPMIECYMGPPFVYSGLLFAAGIDDCVCAPIQPCKQTAANHSTKIPESITPLIPNSTKCVSGTSFSPLKTKKREVSFPQCG